MERLKLIKGLEARPFIVRFNQMNKIDHFFYKIYDENIYRKCLNTDKMEIRVYLLKIGIIEINALRDFLVESIHEVSYLFRIEKTKKGFVCIFQF